MTPPIASTSSWLSCLRPLMATEVMRKPAELASALRASLSGRRQFLDMAAPDDAEAWRCRAGSARSRAMPARLREIAFEPARSAAAVHPVRDRGAGFACHRAAAATRATARPRQWRPLSGQLGASAIAATERGVLHHPLHELVKCCPQTLASSGTNDSLGDAGSGFRPRGRGGPVPSMRSSKRKSARLTPGSQAPHAPPALTFGLTGKQMVNPMRPMTRFDAPVE